MGTFQGCLWGPRGVAEAGYISSACGVQGGWLSECVCLHFKGACGVSG